MRKDFVNEVARTQNVKRADPIEKDLTLHQVLFDLSKNKFFNDNFVFKGGTCLAKCYLDYFRLSEDIDFTWKDQSVFEGKSQKEISGMSYEGKLLTKARLDAISILKRYSDTSEEELFTNLKRLNPDCEDSDLLLAITKAKERKS